MTKNSSNRSANNKKKKGKLLVIIVILLLFLILLLLIGLYFYFSSKDEHVLPGKKTATIQDSSAHKRIPTRVKIDTLKPEPQELTRDTIRPKPKKRTHVVKKATPVEKDTIAIDTIDTIIPETILYDPCIDDTIAPWVYPDPSGGLHYGKITIHFISSKPCSISWRFNDEKTWNHYSSGSDSIEIAQNITLCYKAKDSCGNSMDIRCEQYEIAMPHKQQFCPEDMEYITFGNRQFCIDRYEWPNKMNYKPKSNISIYHAMDSCFKAGKRLCTTEEWSLACTGIHNWKYSYGDTYEPNACVTRDTSVQLIGKRPECRGYFQVFDMSGNLAEWTNTKSKKNSSFYNVMGGFWDSGPQSTCTDARYSYYPTNTHNPVGFRCCKEENKEGKKSK